MPSYRTRVLVLGASHDLTVVWRRPVPVQRDVAAAQRFDQVLARGGWRPIADYNALIIGIQDVGFNLSQPWWAGVAFLHIGDDADLWVVTDSTGTDVLGVSSEYMAVHGRPDLRAGNVDLSKGA